MIPTRGRDHPGRGRRRHRLRHDGRQDHADGERPARQPGGAALGDRARGAARPHRPAARAIRGAWGKIAGPVDAALGDARPRVRASSAAKHPQLGEDQQPSPTSARSAPATTSSRSASTRRSASGSCCTRARAASATASARYFIELAKQDMRTAVRQPARPGPRVLPGGHASTSTTTSRRSAGRRTSRALNREVMMDARDRGRADRDLPSAFDADVEAVNCHHNYVAARAPLRRGRARDPQGRGARAAGRARHHPGLDGRAQLHRARQGQPGDRSTSCRTAPAARCSRSEAKRRFTLEDHVAATEGVECRKDEDVIDETPAAYKDDRRGDGGAGAISSRSCTR